MIKNILLFNEFSMKIEKTRKIASCELETASNDCIIFVGWHSFLHRLKRASAHKKIVTFCSRHIYNFEFSKQLSFQHRKKTLQTSTTNRFAYISLGMRVPSFSNHHERSMLPVIYIAFVCFHFNFAYNIYGSLSNIELCTVNNVF